eukprot:GHVS01063240.1.p1 GENE.GHVS01063240.1~~GHVS01063240.1.p1  ORF type:complete len:214 (+),score=14.30 GHVS01063240.1:53-694(+)
MISWSMKSNSFIELALVPSLRSQVLHERLWRLLVCCCQEALLSSGDVNVLLFETFPDPKEARVVLELLKEFPCMRGRVWMSFSCKSPSLTCSGDDFSAGVAELLQVDGHDKFIKCVGVNCVAPAFVGPLIASLHDRYHPSHVSFLACPNSGEVWDGDIKSWTKKPPQKWYTEYLPSWLKTNLFGVVGACCRNNVEDIRNIRYLVDKWKDQHPT